jgi:hypothetical protein
MEVVGKSTPLSIEYRDQYGNLMIDPPKLDSPPVWTNSNAGAETLTPATDAPTAMAAALVPGRDLVHVRVSVNGKAFGASRRMQVVDAAHQVLTSIEIVAGDPVDTPPPPAPVTAAPSSGSTTSGSVSSGLTSLGSPPLNAEGLRTDGPTLEAYEALGYPASSYPPVGYAEKPSPGLTAYKAAQAASLAASTGSTSTGSVASSTGSTSTGTVGSAPHA